MINIFLFTLILFASVIGIVTAYLACVRSWRNSWSNILEKARLCAIKEADLAGIELSPCAAWISAVFALPARYFFAYKRKKWLVKADRQLPDALLLLSGALKAGLALSPALEMASLELRAPLGGELARAVSQIKLGRTVEEALNSLGERLVTDDVALVVQSIEVLRRTGGNLCESFRTLADTIESRLAVEERIRVITFEALVQAAVLLAMPWVLVAGLWLIAPSFVMPLLNTKLGVVFLLGALLLEAIGATWLKKIIIVRV